MDKRGHSTSKKHFQPTQDVERSRRKQNFGEGFSKKSQGGKWVQSDRGRAPATLVARSQLCFHLQSHHFPGNAGPPGQKPFAKGLFHLQSYHFPGNAFRHDGYLSELVCGFSTSFFSRRRKRARVMQRVSQLSLVQSQRFEESNFHILLTMTMLFFQSRTRAQTTVTVCHAARYISKGTAAAGGHWSSIFRLSGGACLRNFQCFEFWPLEKLQSPFINFSNRLLRRGTDLLTVYAWPATWTEEQPTRFDLRCRSRPRPIDRDGGASANFEQP